MSKLSDLIWELIDGAAARLQEHAAKHRDRPLVREHHFIDNDPSYPHMTVCAYCHRLKTQAKPHERCTAFS